MIQASMQTGHKPDKQDMIPDAREIMRTWYGTFMGHMGHELNLVDTANRAGRAPNAPQMSHKSSHNAFGQLTLALSGTGKALCSPKSLEKSSQKIIEIIQNNLGVTIAKLSKQVGISDRAIEKTNFKT